MADIDKGSSDDITKAFLRISMFAGVFVSDLVIAFIFIFMFCYAYTFYPRTFESYAFKKKYIYFHGLSPPFTVSYAFVISFFCQLG